MIHFFTLDALTFCISAFSIYSLKSHVPKNLSDAPKKSIGIWQSIMSGVHLVREKPGMTYIFFSKAATTGPWNLALMIGFPLLVHQMTNGDAKSFGLVMASYGLGNFFGSLYFGNQVRKRLHHMLFTGYMWLGLGFVLLGLAPSLFWVISAAALAGLSGPMNDLAFIDLMQKEYEVKDLTKVFRLRLAVEAAGTLFFTLLSPWMIKATDVRTVIVMCGTIWVLVGAVGWVRTHRRGSL
jgi:predicted MFS family arabinose efflux permease